MTCWYARNDVSVEPHGREPNCFTNVKKKKKEKLAWRKQQSWFDDVTLCVSLPFQNSFISTSGASQCGAPMWQPRCCQPEIMWSFLGGGPSAWPQRWGGKGRLNYSSAIANSSTEINTKWVSWKWRLVLAGPGFFEHGVKCVNKSKCSRTPTGPRAPFKTRTQSRKIHFFRSFIAAFHVCYPALWVRAARHKPLRGEALPIRVGVRHVLRYNRATVISAVHRMQSTTDGMWRFYFFEKHSETRFVYWAGPSKADPPPPSSVGCVNNSCIFCILSALYIFIRRVCQHHVWKLKVCCQFCQILL